MDLNHYDTKKSVFLDTSTPFTLKERIKMALLIVTVPPRLMLAFFLLSLFAFFSYISTLGWDEDKPLTGWRAELVKFCRHLTMICVYIMGFRVHVHGWENYKTAMKDNIRLGLFNHVSYVDAFVLVGLMTCSGLSKESNRKLPILGSCIRGLQNIYLPDHRQIFKINKDSSTKSQTREDSVSRIVAERIQDSRYPILALAPEGTCGSGYCMLKFRTGAFVSGAPVLPILLKYNTKCINPAWTNINEGSHFLRVLCQFTNRVDVTFLKPYYPSVEEKADATLYAENVRKLMANELGIPLSDECYNHMYALSKLGIFVCWDGKTISDPKKVIDKDGFVDLTPALDKKLK